MRRTPLKLVTVAIAMVLVVTALRFALRALSRHYLFPTAQVTPWTRGDFAGVQRLVFRAHDGVPVHALWLAPPREGPVVVSFHNNRSVAEDQVPMARALASRGFGVALVEYRGYGSTQGFDPSEGGLFLDAEAVLDGLAARGIGPARIVLLGISLGTGVAAEMARAARGSALVLVAPFTSIPDLVRNVVPFAPASQIVSDAFDTLSRGGAIHLPTLVIHGDADEIVPFWMGQRVAHAIAGARFISVAGGHHGDLFVRAGDRLFGEVTALLAR